MSELRVNNITNRDGKTGTVVAGIPQVTSTSHFVPPSGTTAERGSRGRGVLGGSDNPTRNIIDYFTIATLGNASDFGDLTRNTRGAGGCSSATRGIFGGGLGENIIEYITISSTGNAFDFGDLTTNRFLCDSATSNSTRGLFAGGYQPTGSIFLQTIDFITISTLGNASSFGDMSDRNFGSGCVSNTTRSIFGGGCRAQSTANVFNTIQYVTISTTGNTQDFGDLTVARDAIGASSNSVRAVFGGGDTENPASGANTNVIDFITIATLGDAQDFGDMTVSRERLGGCSSSTRGVFMGGMTVESPNTSTNTIDYITFSSTGDAADFGDLTSTYSETAGLSDSHGGLG